jgi:hypothetical protein
MLKLEKIIEECLSEKGLLRIGYYALDPAVRGIDELLNFKLMCNLFQETKTVRLFTMMSCMMF